MAEETRATVQRAWELCHLDLLAAGDLAHDGARRAAQGPAAAGQGADVAETWLLVALCEVRVGGAGMSLQALTRADRTIYPAKNQGRARLETAPRTGFSTLT